MAKETAAPLTSRHPRPPPSKTEIGTPPYLCSLGGVGSKRDSIASPE